METPSPQQLAHITQSSEEFDPVCLTSVSSIHSGLLLPLFLFLSILINIALILVALSSYRHTLHCMTPSCYIRWESMW